IDDLSNPKYFPYRYGQVFWAFLTGLKGDEMIEPFFTAVAKYGFDAATRRVLGMTKKDLSRLWVDGVKRHFGAAFDTTAATDRFVGRELIGAENGGRMNVAPEISPNGRYVIFLSEKDLFSVDLYLADARTGEVIRKVASSTRNGHIDDFNYIESSGTWSNNSKEFAFVAFSKGRNILVVKDVASGKTVKELRPEGLKAFSNPAWSPDGKQFVVSGMVNGETDLYLIDARTGATEPLTNDAYSEMHPRWSENGNVIVYATDRLSRKRGRTNGRWTFNLATFDMASLRSRDIDVFPGADNLNPVFDTTGNIVFLSNRDGFRNIYRYELGSQKVFQLTDLITGVSGITHYAPAISVARRRDRVLYTYFSQKGYRIYRARPIDFLNKEVDANDVDFTAAALPRFNKAVNSRVDRILHKLPAKAEIPDSALTTVPYKPKFKLDYMGGSAGVGVGASNTFGAQTGLAGGIDMLFSDILGDNQLYTSLALNGEITDFGGAVAYINRKRQLNWGASISHMPFRSFAFGGAGIEQLQIDDDLTVPVLADTFFVQRIFEDKATVFAAYPFSTTLRLEGAASFARYSSRLDQYVNFYETDGTFVGRQLGQEREKLDSLEGFNLWNTGLALVGYNTQGGLVGPLNGHRFRFGVDRFFGTFDYYQITADYRKYKYFNWFGLAFRAMHIGRYGQDADGLFPYYAGSSWFIRGYSTSDAGTILNQNGRSVEELFGSKLAVANFEVRIPFTGPKRLALLNSGLLFSELTLFADAAVAWNDFDQLSGPTYRTDNEGNPIIWPTGEPVVDQFAAQPLMSVGASMRVNVFGALVLEPYYAIPLQRETRGTFGLN
ncbi:MAG: PD40 domain-containing protein, partial [Phaeodactylibacter sp.]|nr:PD40 domain-containing protein [Phaeodactylibacter sp.]